MKKFFLILSCLLIINHTEALIINEIMSNPVGDDGGREWVEIYNNSSSTLDISSLSFSIKGGTAIPVGVVSGGSILLPDTYAIVGSTVSGATKFLQDYPSYLGLLLKSSISLVNTGVTSIEIKMNGSSLDTLSSYTAAKEGMTFSRVAGSFVVTNPTPGAENQKNTQEDDANTTSSTTVITQMNVAQSAPPSSDIVMYMPQEKTIVAGQESNFSVFALTRSGKGIENLVYTWAYGDGGQAVGSTTMYRYAYPGKYIVQVEGSNGYILGTGRMTVRVVAPEIAITGINNGKYGSYIDISNPNLYDLDFSQWKLSIDDRIYLFPKNTLVAGGSVTHFSGLAMGFASTTITENSVIKILFPNMEEVTRYEKEKDVTPVASTTFATPLTNQDVLRKTAVQVFKQNKRIATTSLKTKPIPRVLGVSSTTFQKEIIKASSPIIVSSETKKDARIVGFFKGMFGR